MKDGLEIAQVAWTIDPSTIYGFLIAFMLIIIVILGLSVKYLFRKMEGFSAKLLTVLAENTSAFESLKSTIDDHNDHDKRTIRDMRFTNYMDKKFDELKGKTK